MQLVPAIEQTAIITFVELIGNGDIFHRIKDEIERTNAAMPDADGADKRAKVLADAKIIFDDLAVPVAEPILNLLIELGVSYLKAQIAK
ncbi:MAG: hypothetical protein ACXWAT_00125 [Methylobacter sp.]